MTCKGVERKSFTGRRRRSQTDLNKGEASVRYHILQEKGRKYRLKKSGERKPVLRFTCDVG